MCNPIGGPGEWSDLQEIALLAALCPEFNRRALQALFGLDPGDQGPPLDREIEARSCAAGARP